VPSAVDAADTTGASDTPGAPDCIYYNGTVITVDPTARIASALAFKDGLIAAVGDDAELRALASPATRLVDLAGKTVIPGAIDAHGHFGKVVKFADWVTLIPSTYTERPTRSIDDLVQTLIGLRDSRDFAPGEFIVGHSYHELFVEEKRLLNRFDLDRVSTTQPVAAAHASFHLFSFNSVALGLLGIDATSEDSSTNRIFRVEDSREPNGIVQGPIAQQFFFGISVGDDAKKVAAFEKAQQWYFSYGITQAQEGKSSFEDIETIHLAQQAKVAQLDIASFVDYEAIDEVLERLPYAVGTPDGHLRICGLKVISDGTLSSGAFLSEPFNGTEDDYGIEYVSYAELKVQVRKALLNNWQFMVHAMGDAAIDKLLNIYEEVLVEEGLSPEGRRNIINHASGIRRNQLERVRRLGLIISFYPSAASALIELFERTLGPTRAATINPLASALREGIVVTAHNDAPIIEPNPFVIWWAAVNRKSATSGREFAPEERVSVYDGLRLFTIDAAYQHGEEDVRGSLEVGKKADALIIDRNPFAIDTDELKDIRVLATIKDGVVVYEAPEAARTQAAPAPEAAGTQAAPAPEATSTAGATGAVRQQ
jgi:predicted amidohydrolase YtcJ